LPIVSITRAINKTKYINIKHHFIKNKTKSKDITFKYTPSTNILANILTKLLVYKATQKITASLKLRKGKKKCTELGKVLDYKLVY